MGANCTRFKPKPFYRLRKFFQDRKERRREKKLQKELNLIRRQVGELAADAASGGAASADGKADGSSRSAHGSKSSASSKGSKISGSASSSDTEQTGNCFLLSRQGKNDEDSDDESDDSDGEGIPLAVKTASDNILLKPSNDARADTDMDMEDIFTSSLRLRKIVSDLSEVHKRAITAEDARQKAFHRGCVSLTGSITKNKLQSIPENDVLANVTWPLPTSETSTEQPQGELPEDFHPPGFIP